MENDTIKESRQNKIRGLLAKAEATDFPAEAETYTAKAVALMAQWGIEASLLDAKASVKSEVIDRIFEVFAPFTPNKVSFLNQVVSVLGGRAVLIHRYKGQTGPRKMHVFATTADMERIDMIYTSLLVQCTTAMNYAVEVSRVAKLQPRKFKSDFFYGFFNEVSFRLRQAEYRATKEAETAATEQGTTTDLVLRGKQDRVNDRVESHYNKLITTSARKRTVGAGYGHGVDAGKRADIGDKKAAKQGALVG